MYLPPKSNIVYNIVIKVLKEYIVFLYIVFWMIKDYDTSKNRSKCVTYFYRNINCILEDEIRPTEVTNENLRHLHTKLEEGIHFELNKCSIVPYELQVAAEKVRKDIQKSQELIEQQEKFDLQKVNCLPDDCIHHILSFIPGEMEKVHELTVLRKKFDLFRENILRKYTKTDIFRLLCKSLPVYGKRFASSAWNSSWDGQNIHRQEFLLKSFFGVSYRTCKENYNYFIQSKLLHHFIHTLQRVRIDSLCDTSVHSSCLSYKDMCNFSNPFVNIKDMSHNISYAYHLCLLLTTYEKTRIKRMYAYKLRMLQQERDKELQYL